MNKICARNFRRWRRPQFAFVSISLLGLLIAACVVLVAIKRCMVNIVLYLIIMHSK